MLALISDIHSNWEALSAVLADIASRGIGRIFCLGDVVGYGPDPARCLDTVMDRCQSVILGNHDSATIYEPTHFNAGAENAAYWTRSVLEDDSPKTVASRLGFLGRLPSRLAWDGAEFGAGKVLLVHGSPRRPINEYIFPDDVMGNPARIQAAFDRFEHLCFVGHTHVPGVFTEGPAFHSPEDLEGEFAFDADKAMINVGSVGQPRDHDPRAGYVILQKDKITFVRVDYDFRATMQKVFAIRELDDYLGTRLQDGR